MRTLSAVARTGSIGTAARALGVSQPAVSSRLRRLEAKLGVVLLERGARGSVLTPSGNRLLGYAERAVALADEAASVVGRLGSGPRLAIGAHASVATAIAPTLAAAADELGLDLELVDQHTPELLRLVSDGVLRAAVVNGSALMPGLVGHHLWDVPVDRSRGPGSPAGSSTIGADCRCCPLAHRAHDRRGGRRHSPSPAWQSPNDAASPHHRRGSRPPARDRRRARGVRATAGCSGEPDAGHARAAHGPRPSTVARAALVSCIAPSSPKLPSSSTSSTCSASSGALT